MINKDDIFKFTQGTVMSYTFLLWTGMVVVKINKEIRLLGNTNYFKITFIFKISYFFTQ